MTFYIDILLLLYVYGYELLKHICIDLLENVIGIYIFHRNRVAIVYSYVSTI